MRYIFVVIVLLSFIGIFINLTGADTPNTKTLPEFKQEQLPTDNPHTNEETKQENLGEQFVHQQMTLPKFDAMGNRINTKGNNGLSSGRNLVNTKAKNGGVPTTRLADFASASALRIIDDDFGTPERIVTLKNSGLPFTAYADYELGSLEPVTAKDMEDNPGPMRTSKVESQLGQIYTPEPDFMTESTFRQPTVSHNRLDIKAPIIERTNKLDTVYMGAIDRAKLNDRNAKIVHRVMPSVWEVNDKPNVNMISADKDRDAVSDRHQLRNDYIETLQKVGTNDVIRKMQEKM
jgi:hypothetical protein